jgi:hypothetical protein
MILSHYAKGQVTRQENADYVGSITFIVQLEYSFSCCMTPSCHFVQRRFIADSTSFLQFCLTQPTPNWSCDQLIQSFFVTLGKDMQTRVYWSIFINDITRENLYCTRLCQDLLVWGGLRFEEVFSILRLP